MWCSKKKLFSDLLCCGVGGNFAYLVSCGLVRVPSECSSADRRAFRSNCVTCNELKREGPVHTLLAAQVGCNAVLANRDPDKPRVALDGVSRQLL